MIVDGLDKDGVIFLKSDAICIDTKSDSNDGSISVLPNKKAKTILRLWCQLQTCIYYTYLFDAIVKAEYKVDVYEI